MVKLLPSNKREVKILHNVSGIVKPSRYSSRNLQNLF